MRGKKNSRSRKTRDGNKGASGSIVSRKEEEEEMSNLGFVFCCEGRGKIDWYSVDSLFVNQPATQICPPPAQYRLAGFSCASIGSKLIVLGASMVDISLEASKHVFCLDKKVDGFSWTRLPDMICGRYDPVVVSVSDQNKVYVFGSHNYQPTHHISIYGEFLDMSLRCDQWKWEPLPPPPFYTRKDPEDKEDPEDPYFPPISAAFVIDIDGQQEIAVGLSSTTKTYSLNLKTHQWTNRRTRFPFLDWLDGASSVIVVDNRILLVLWGGSEINAYDLVNSSWFPHPVTGLEDYPFLGYFIFQSSRKRDVYLVVSQLVLGNPPTYCIRFQIQTYIDPQGIPRVSAVVKSTTGPFRIAEKTFLLLPLGEKGEEEEGTV